MNKKYLRYTIYSIKASMFEAVIWAALASFALIGRTNLGVENVNIMEAVMYIMPIVGTFLAFNKFYRISLKNVILFLTLADTVFLLTVIYMLNNNINYGIAIYCIMFVGILTRPIKRERMRKFEDTNLIHMRYKYVMEKIREKTAYSESIALISGAILTLILVNVLKLDLNTIAVYLLVLNLFQNSFDYYAWVKYIK